MKRNVLRVVLFSLLPGMVLAQNVSAGSQWETEEQQDDELGLYFVVLKTHAVGPNKPALVFRCFEDTTVAYVNLFGQDETGTYEYDSVTVQLDDGAPKTYSMHAIDDGHALGFWESDSAIPFIQDLFGAQTLSMHITPTEGEAMRIAFNIDNIEEKIAPLRQACGW